MRSASRILIAGLLVLICAVFGYGWHLRTVYRGVQASTNSGKALFDRQTLEHYGQQLLIELRRKDVRLAIVSRSGQAREELPDGVMFTHSAFFRRNQAGDFDVYNLYHGEINRMRSSLIIDKPADFLRLLKERDTGILIPDVETQTLLHEFLESPEYRDMHQPDYSLISNPFDLRWQNCNEFMLYAFAAAIWNTTDHEELRETLKEKLTPTELKVSMVRRYYGPKIDERLILKDHGEKIFTTTFGTLTKIFKATGRLKESYVFPLIEKRPN